MKWHEKVKQAKAEDITIVTSGTGDGVAIYIKGELVHAGHSADVFETFLWARYRCEYVPNIVTKNAPGWKGVPENLRGLSL